MLSDMCHPKMTLAPPLIAMHIRMHVRIARARNHARSDVLRLAQAASVEGQGVLEVLRSPTQKGLYSELLWPSRSATRLPWNKGASEKRWHLHAASAAAHLLARSPFEKVHPSVIGIMSRVFFHSDRRGAAVNGGLNIVSRYMRVKGCSSNSNGY